MEIILIKKKKTSIIVNYFDFQSRTHVKYESLYSKYHLINIFKKSQNSIETKVTL